MGFGIYQVKKIVKDLRKDGQLKLWAEDYTNFRKKTTGLPEHIGRDKLKDETDQQNLSGILLYTFTEKESVRHILPYNIAYLMGYKSYLYKILISLILVF